MATKKLEQKELFYQPIGKGGWVSSRARRDEIAKNETIRNLVLIGAVAACIVIDAAMIAIMF